MLSFEVTGGATVGAGAKRAEEYTFDTFARGPDNAAAFGAALLVARGSALAPNPLVLYGPNGSGKTHLVRAVAGQARQRGLDATMVSAEELVGRFLGDLNRAFESTQLLVVEGIQFIAAQQREVGEALCRWVRRGMQVVLTSDVDPGDIGIDRLCPALLPSLAVIGLGSPEPALRLRIVESLALRMGIEVDAVTSLQLAEWHRDAWAIRGALHQINASRTLGR